MVFTATVSTKLVVEMSRMMLWVAFSSSPLCDAWVLMWPPVSESESDTVTSCWYAQFTRPFVGVSVRLSTPFPWLCRFCPAETLLSFISDSLENVPLDKWLIALFYQKVEKAEIISAHQLLCNLRYPSGLNVLFRTSYLFLCLLFSFLFLLLLCTLQLRVSFLLLRQQLPDFDSALHKKPSINMRAREAKVREIMKAIKGDVDGGQGITSCNRTHTHTHTFSCRASKYISAFV